MVYNCKKDNANIYLFLTYTRKQITRALNTHRKTSNNNNLQIKINKFIYIHVVHQ